jgi:hypothetical protein
MAITSDAPSTFTFIRSLITDLPTLETEGVAFKFFLWDQIRSAYTTGGSRPDRVPVFPLNWTVDELSEMLSQRLAAYSEGRLSSLNQMMCEEVGVNAHRLVAYLAGGSPRDMIRLCKRIISEETRTSEKGKCIRPSALWGGIREFATERSQELFGPYLDDLRKVGGPTFTIKELVNDVFRVSDNAVRRKVQIWQDNGIVTKIGEVPNPPNRPAYLFGVTDVRLMLAMDPSEGTPARLNRCVVECPNCLALLVTDRTDVRCHDCGQEFDGETAQTLINLVGGRIA